MKPIKNFIALSICLMFFGSLFSGGSNAQEFLPRLTKLSELINKQNAANQTPAPTLQSSFDNLINRAREKGTVKVIIGLRLDGYKSDGELRGFAQDRQRLDIKEKQESLLNSLNDFAVSNTKRFDYIPFIAMEIPADALAFLRDSSDIISIQEDVPESPSLLQSIPIIGAPAAWNMGFTGQGRTVAILDSGVDKFHPFFNGRVVSEGCYSTNSANSTSICPGGVSESTAPNSGLPCDVNQIESCFHGTHVAGITAGGNPSINGSGVARNAGIISMQVFTILFGESCGNESPCIRTFTSDQIKALERVYALRTTFAIDAVNMSLGGGQYNDYCDSQEAARKAAIDNLRTAGIATIVASGNDGFINSMGAPACISSAISVGSTHDGDVSLIDTVSDFSNSTYYLNLLAPGELITSAYPGGFYYDTQGTSMAAPHVAGAWTVLKQRYPNDSVTQTLNRLTYSGVPTLDSRNGFVKPRIRVDLALNTPNTNPCNTVNPLSFGQTVNGSLSNVDCLLSFGNRADVYSFTGTQGQSITLAQNSSAFDTYLYLFNSSGAVLAQDNNGGGGTNSRIPAGSGSFQLPATGTYYVYATSLEGNRLGNYSLNLTSNTPACSFTVSSGGQAFAAAGGSGSFTVSSAAGCAWTAQSNAAQWLSVTSGGSGNGNGTVNYSVAANTSTTARSGVITAGGQIHTVTQAGAATPLPNRKAFDLDGDGRTDVGIFRPARGEWWYLRSSDGANRAFQFGASADKIVPADYTGDGKTDVAFFRPSSGEWFILRSEDSSFYSFPFGNSGDIPAPSDFDGDGKADPAVFRPSSATWFIIRSSDGGTTITTFGANGDLPVAADYDGDGKSDVAIFRPSTGAWWLGRSSAGLTVTNFGTATDKTVQADYTGDGKADVAFFRPSTGEWFILRSENSSFYSFPFGTTGDIPATGDYDGDGVSDVTIFRPSNATWYINGSTSGTQIFGFGANGDQPIPNAYVR